MARLAPGRKHDMAMLLDRRDKAKPGTWNWTKIQLKIDDLVEEGKCPVVYRERERLVNAARDGNTREVEKISEIINEHMKTKHRQRYTRSWVKKG